MAGNFLKPNTTTGIPTGVAIAVSDLPTAIPNANLATMANNTVKGNISGSSATPSDLTATQVTAFLNAFTSSLQGVVPSSGGGTSNFLRADGTWAAPPSGFTNPMTTLGDIIYENATPAAARLAGNTTSTKNFLSQTGTGTVSAAPTWGTIAAADLPTIALTGNVTGSASGGSIATTIAASAVTLAMHANLAANSVIGNSTGSSATPTAVAMTNAATASTVMFRDSNANVAANSFIEGFATTATAAGTTTLTVSSKWAQQFTGSTTQTVVLPDATTLVVGQSFMIMNRSSGVVTVNANGGGLIQTMAASSQTLATVVTNSVAAGTWDSAYSLTTSGGFTNPMTTQGDVIYGGASGTATRLAQGTANTFLGFQGSSTTPSYQSPNQAVYKNYMQANPDAEVDTTGYATYSNTAANTPSNGTGGTATGLTFSRSTSSPLHGTASFSMVQANSTSLQGKGVSAAFTIDAADQAQVFTINFDYNASSTFVASNGTTIPLYDGTTSTNAGNSDVEVFVYDVTNSVLIPVNAAVITANGTLSHSFAGTFQTASNSTSYRLIWHVATANANATGWTFKFDNVYVGRQQTVQGAVVTDWNTGLAFTFSALGTVTNNLAETRRVGDTLQVRGTVTAGTTTSSSIQINLPSGYAIDYGKFNGTSQQPVGFAELIFSSGSYASSSLGPMPIFVDGTTTGNLWISNTVSSNSLQKASGTGASIASGNLIIYEFSIPITGWSSNVQMSNGLDTRIVAAAYYVSANFAASTTVPINFDTKVLDTTGSVTTSATAWKFTAPVSGTYQVQVAFAPTAGSHYCFVYKNGTCNYFISAEASATYGNGTVLINLVAGDYIDIRPDSSATMSGGNPNNGSNANLTTISIQKLQGPATLAVTPVPRSSVQLSNGNGAGSSNTQIARFSTTITNVGTDITYADSATLGATFTINSPGVYTAHYSSYGGASNYYGISLNSTQLSTSIESITDANILAIMKTGGSGVTGTASATWISAIGDVIRAHDAGSSGTDPRNRFMITKVSN